MKKVHGRVSTRPQQYFQRYRITTRALVALADAIRIHNRTADGRTEFTPDHLRVLADFCAALDPNFNRERWIDYIAGECWQDQLIFVEPDSTPPGAIMEGQTLPRVNRDERSQRAGLRSSIEPNS